MKDDCCTINLLDPRLKFGKFVDNALKSKSQDEVERIALVGAILAKLYNEARNLDKKRFLNWLRRPSEQTKGLKNDLVAHIAANQILYGCLAK